MQQQIGYWIDLRHTAVLNTTLSVLFRDRNSSMRENQRQIVLLLLVLLLLVQVPVVHSFALRVRVPQPVPVHVHVPRHNNNNRSAASTPSTTTTTALFASSSFSKAKQKQRSKTATSASLLAWARDSAGIDITTQIDLCSTPEAGWGWRWKKNKEQTPVSGTALLLTVPASAVIAVDAAAAANNGDSAGSSMPWYVDLSLSLLQQQPSSSPWRDALPSQLDTPLHWSSSSLRELQYAPLSEAVAQQDQQWRTYYDQYVTSTTTTNIDYASFVWGCEMARSRAFAGAYGSFSTQLYAFTLLLVTVTVGLQLGTLEQAANGAGLVFVAAVWKDFVWPKLFPVQRYVICPMIDMANHRSTPGATATVEYEFFRHAYSLVTTTTSNSGTDDAITISYGERSNDQLLQYYGFVEPDNPHDVYVLPPIGEWTYDTATATTEKGRLAVLQQAGLLSCPIVVTRDKGIDPVALRALRVMYATEEEWTERAQQAVTSIDTATGSTTEETVRTAARTLLQQELDAKPTTLEQDRVLLSRCKETEERLAIQFRMEKKKVLLEAISKL